jgi:HlyD family secretion protein
MESPALHGGEPTPDGRGVNRDGDGPAARRVSGVAQSGDAPAAPAQRDRVKASIEHASRSRRRRWLGFVVVLLLLGGAAFVYFQMRTDAQQAKQPRYESIEVRRGDLKAIVTATGQLEALDQVDVGAELSGRITEVLVDFNDRVEEGQVLCKLDAEQWDAAARQARAQLSANQASLQSAKASVEEAELVAQRSRALHAEGILSQQELDTAEASVKRTRAAVDLAKSQVALARAALGSSKTTLEKTVIRSPISGVVLARNVEPGQTVAAALAAPVLFTLARDLKQMELIIDIDEADIGQVSEDQVASFSVDAFAGREFPAQIVSIHNLATTKDNVVTYQAVLRVDNSELQLRPGMTATVTIVTAERSDVVLVPNRALRFTPPSEIKDIGGPRFSMFGRGRGNQKHEDEPKADEEAGEAAQSGPKPSTVWIEEAGKPRAVSVRIGLSDGEWTEVLDSELQVGTPVLVDVLANGG